MIQSIYCTDAFNDPVDSINEDFSFLIQRTRVSRRITASETRATVFVFRTESDPSLGLPSLRPSADDRLWFVNHLQRLAEPSEADLLRSECDPNHLQCLFFRFRKNQAINLGFFPECLLPPSFRAWQQWTAVQTGIGNPSLGANSSARSHSRVYDSTFIILEKNHRW